VEQKLKWKICGNIPPEACLILATSNDSDLNKNVKFPEEELHIFLGALHILDKIT